MSTACLQADNGSGGSDRGGVDTVVVWSPGQVSLHPDFPTTTSSLQANPAAAPKPEDIELVVSN